MNQRLPIILFDGVCNLCNAAINFILKRDKRKQFRYISLQSDEGVKLVKSYQIPEETDSVILILNETVYIESEAAIEIGRLLPWPWKWSSGFRIIPKKLRDGIYRWIARNRYRWFGKRNTCRFIQN
ncbi:thiol-disulfide oxidoreductase DCC family protein [Maribellus sediminis]|uniref:thiol-disulfide oxidoreductase DCC family protein n=1 Tax=Maribellus sediminis TaxID=2696285 RepID=UPI001431380B|nr:DCC1-like thiol-disulfide oxidoreductase family protein [Maribellus sediminis]